VAEDGEVVVLVEVKTRRGTGYGLPQEAVDRRKQAKLVALLDAFRAATGRLRQPCRIDVVAVLVDARREPVRIEHIRNAVGG
jgi:putative endonuclease